MIQYYDTLNVYSVYAGPYIAVFLSVLMLTCLYDKRKSLLKQGIDTTGPPAIIRLEAAWRHCLACAGEAASSLIIARRGVLQTTTDAREQNNTGPLLYV